MPNRPPKPHRDTGTPRTMMPVAIPSRRRINQKAKGLKKFRVK